MCTDPSTACCAGKHGSNSREAFGQKKTPGGPGGPPGVWAACPPLAGLSACGGEVEGLARRRRTRRRSIRRIASGGSGCPARSPGGSCRACPTRSRRVEVPGGPPETGLSASLQTYPPAARPMGVECCMGQTVICPALRVDPSRLPRRPGHAAAPAGAARSVARYAPCVLQLPGGARL